MKIIKDSRFVKLPSETPKRFFIQAWYSLIHQSSLDSHRIRCMNSSNILRELQDLIGKRDFPNIDKDVKAVCAEVITTISKDDFIKKFYIKNIEKIDPLLHAILKSGVKTARETLDITSYFLRDFLDEIKNTYKTNIIQELKRLIFETDDLDYIYKNLSNLLTQLIDEGHSIEELFAIVQNVFIKNRSRKAFSFDENLEFATGVITRPLSKYDIIFRLEGCKMTEYLIDFFEENIKEVIDPQIKIGEKQNISSFLNPGQNVLFAQFNVSAQDDRSAGLVARRELEDLLDLARFELESDILTIDNEFLSFRENGSTIRRFRLPNRIPNPKKTIEKDEFKNFVEVINRLLKGGNIDTDSKEKIKSGFRFYRVGRDSDRLENKFLNWWIALEFLTRSGGMGSIVESVEKVLIPALSLKQTTKYLISFRNALTYCNVKGIGKDMTAYDLFLKLRKDDEFNNIISQLTQAPLLKFHLEKFKKNIESPKSLYNFISEHEQNLSWHIRRLWRIRCDIVHSAEHLINLTLL